MAIKEFLNSEYKKVDDDLEVILNKIAKSYSIMDKTYGQMRKMLLFLSLGILR